jgi:DNA-binding GntR family transcriptional regulator
VLHTIRRFGRIRAARQPKEQGWRRWPLSEERAKSQEIYRALREDILVGRLRPGERLREEELARHFEVSRTPIREVLTRLEAEHLVVQVRFRGAAVRQFTEDEVRGIYDLRCLLEGYAAHEAALRGSPDDVRELEELARGMAERVEALGGSAPVEGELLEAIVEVNQAFHGGIARASHNPYLLTVLQNVIQLPLVFRSMQYYGPDGIRTSVQHHQAIARAIRERDAERAEALMRVHVYHGRDVLFEHLEELQIARRGTARGRRTRRLAQPEG